MGAKTWKKYLKKFHIGEKTGVTLPGEQPGTIAFSSPIDQAVTSFGQGVDVNVMQMMQAFSSLANDGQMVKPQFVEKITDADNHTITGYQIKNVGQPVYTKETASTVLENMRRVLNKRIGTGSAYQMKGKSIAVKTGTAQIANLKGGGYLKGNNNYIFSVVGVTPAKHPRYCIYITVKQPRKMSKPAEVILSSIFKPMMNRVILMSKNGLSSPTAVKTPNLKGLNYKEAEKVAQRVGLRLAKIGTGDKITEQSYSVGQKQQSGKLMLVRTAGSIECPDMKGWSIDELHQFADLTGVKLSIKGTGVVFKQSLAIGQPVKSGTKIKIQLKE